MLLTYFYIIVYLTKFMKDIFEKTKLGNLNLNSRIIRTGLWQTQDMLDVYNKYETIAESGVGLIITELIAIYPKDKFSEYSFKSSYPQFIIEAKKLAEITHKYGVPILGQIELIKYNKGINLDVDINDMTLDDIRQIQVDIFNTAKKLKLAGFDGIQLALGNNFFLSKFINPYFNSRDDDYGGSTFNRMRLVSEIIKVMKENLDFHINCKVNAFDGRKNGINKDESIKICKLLEKYGADSIQVTRPLSPLYFTHEVSNEKELVEFSEELIKNVNIPVILGGGFNNIAHMNELINRTNIEFLSMYRPFIAQEDFLKEWKEKGEGSSRCKMCNNCYRTKTSTCYHY